MTRRAGVMALTLGLAVAACGGASSGDQVRLRPCVVQERSAPCGTISALELIAVERQRHG